MKKTLLLTSSVPGSGNVGQLLVERMLREVPDLPIAIACVSNATHEDKLGLGPEVQFTPEIHEQAKPATTRRLPQLLIAAKRFAHRNAFARQADSIAEFALRSGCEQVWSILSSLNLIEVTEHVSRRLSGQLITQVWDDVEHLARQRSFHGIALRTLKHRFGQCLAASARTGVIGETMAKCYSRQYQANTVIIRLGAQETRPFIRAKHNKSEYTIAFTGGMYCNSAFRKLLDALDLCQWECQNKRIRLRVFSNEAHLHSRANANIEFFGWRDAMEIETTLQESDLLYLPQPFESECYPLAHLSFPTKMSNYVATGVPILVHSPPHSSLSLFAKDFVGLQICNSLDPQEISTHINRLLTDEETRYSATLASRAIASQVLTQDRFRDGVRTLLGLPTHQELAEMTSCENPRVV
jgi:hypothetical protein